MKLDGAKVLVTGGKGFLGKHVVQALKIARAYVLVPAHSEMDCLDRYQIDDFIGYHKPDIVVHLAARVGGIGANQAEPARFFYENMLMGLNIIHASAMWSVQKFLLLGSCCSYPKFAKLPQLEEYLFSGYPEDTNAAYGIAKRSLIVMLNSYRQQYGFNGISLIPANLYGSGDSLDTAKNHVIPAMIIKFLHAKAKNAPNVTLWGTGKPTREFLYVEDCADAIVQALEKYDQEYAINIGTGEEISIKELSQLIAKKVEYKGEIVFDTSKPDGQPRRKLDTEKAQFSFGWKAQTPLEEGLIYTIEDITRRLDNFGN